MKQYILAVLFLLPLTALGQTAGVSSDSTPSWLYFCDEEDRSECFLLLPDGSVVTREEPTGRGAIDYDMQNWQWAKDNIMGLPEGEERDRWEQDAVYWQVRLIADKAYARLAAAIVPPLFGILSSPEHSEPIIESYRERYAKATKLIIIMETFFGLPHNDPVGN